MVVVSRRLSCLPRAAAVTAAALLLCGPAQAYLVGIASGPRTLYLQVGTGTFTGTFTGGGTPGNNATRNTVSVSVAPAALGTGSVAMTSNSSVTNSPYDNYVFCTALTQVYVGGFYRGPNTAAATATLSVNSATPLSNGAGATIPFTQISWVSSGIGDATPTIPSGTFTATTSQALLTVTRNTWFESCLAFSYANAQFVRSGVFNGTATYTLSAP